MPSLIYTSQKTPSAYAIQLYSGIHVYALWQDVPKLLYAIQTIRTSESSTRSK